MLLLSLLLLIVLLFSPVDYQHSDTSATPLMVATGRGLIGIVEQLLNLGADPSLKASNDWTALDWAKKFQHEEIIDMLEAAMYVCFKSAMVFAYVCQLSTPG